jgi:hypothetical protein
MGFTALRGLILLGGFVIGLAGLGLIAIDSAAIVPGLYLVVIGIVLVVATVLERERYRSAHAEQTDARPGPGGGEPLDSPLGPPFRPTAEVFEDPTTNRRMRVWLDPGSGERRYREDGA